MKMVMGLTSAPPDSAAGMCPSRLLRLCCAPAQRMTHWLLVQMSKLGMAMVMGRTGAPPVTAAGLPHGSEAGENGHTTPMDIQEEDTATDENAVKPQRFKSLVGRGHPEFSSARQQVRPICSLWMICSRLSCSCRVLQCRVLQVKRLLWMCSGRKAGWRDRGLSRTLARHRPL